MFSTIKNIGLTLLVFGTLPILTGFGILGISGGSLAAFFQSIIGNVSAGSFFAGMTSLGMKGFFAKIATTGGAMAIIGKLFESKKKPKKTFFWK